MHVPGTEIWNADLVSLMFHFRPHPLHAVHRCGQLLQMSHVAWSVFLYVFVSLCSAQVKTMQKWLNLSRYHLGTDSFGSKKPCMMEIQTGQIHLPPWDSDAAFWQINMDTNWHQQKWLGVTLKVTFTVWNLANFHTSENIASLIMIYLNMHRKVHVACNFNYLFETERLFKSTILMK